MTLEFFPCLMIGAHIVANIFVQRALWRRAGEHLVWRLFWSAFSGLFFIFGPLFYGIAVPPPMQAPALRIKRTAAISERDGYLH